MNPRSILVISVARIGDTILLTPALKAIKARYPEAKLTVLAHPKRMEVLAHLPAIDRLEAATKTKVAWRGWWPGKSYDLAVIYGRDVALVRYALRVSRKVICFDEPEFSALSAPELLKVLPPTAPVHAVQHRLMLLEPIGIDQVDDLSLSFSLTDLELQASARLLAERGLSQTHPLIGLQLFSFPAKAHRDWPMEHFASLIDALAAHYPQARFVVLGDRLAAERAIPLLARFSRNLSSVSGQFNLRQSAAFMSHLDLYVGVDTGPTHIAGALGVPMVAMYHWRYPAEYLRPLMSESCIAIAHPATGGGNQPHFVQGMEAIGVQPVLDAARRLIDMGRR